MPTTANSITYYVAADGTLRDGPQGSIAQQPRINYGTEYSVTLTFPASTIAEGDQLQVALNRTRTFFSSASATGDAPVAAVAKHDVTAEEATAQEVVVVLSTNTRAMIDQVNGIDHPVRGFFGVHVLRGQSFVTLAVADALMMSLESGPDAISPSLPVVDYPTREEAVALAERSEAAAGRAETAQGKAEEAQGKAETAEHNAKIWAEGTDQQIEELGGEHSAKEYDRLAGVSATNAGQSATNAGQSATQAGQANEAAQTAKSNAAKIAEGTDEDVAPLGLEHSAKGWAQEAAATLASKRDILQTLVTSSATSLEVEAGKSYNWTVSAASTIALAAADKVANKETRIDIYIDLQDGGSVTGDGVAVADAVLQSGWYKLIWDGTGATLYSTKAGGAASVVTIPAATTSYTLQDNKHYQQIPSAVPTYTLPSATMDGLVHEITVLVDFLHVTSCSFLDAGGVPVTLQSAISPQIGEAYVFRCYWYGKWRVVPLKIRNAATASSATGVVEVSDAVAGDALSLKMVAPRSVVVNQLSESTTLTGWQIVNNFVSMTYADGYYTLTITQAQAGFVKGYKLLSSISNFRSGHKYAMYFEVRNYTAKYAQLSWQTNAVNSSSLFYIRSAIGESSNDWKAYSGVSVVTNDAGAYLLVSINAGASVGQYAEFRNMMCVDLTAYFNGDTALIDSITSWDDLVAYDPRFAQYVEYNTGTVTGVQPQVKVTGKNLFNEQYLSPFPRNWYYKHIYVGNNDVTGSTDMPNKTSLNSVYLVAGIVTSGVGVISAFYNGHPKTVSAVGGYVTLACRYPSGGYDPRNYHVQVELGSEATAYEPYHDGGTAQAPAPLFAVGSAADEFEAVSGVTTSNIGSYTFTGEETPTVWRPAEGYYAVSFPASMVDMLHANRSVICDFLLTRNYPELYNIDSPVQGISSGMTVTTNYSFFIRVQNSIASNKTELMAWLTGKTVYYVKATPTTSQSTPTQISLQAGSNVAMQTDGGRTLAELALTYENLPTAD